MIADDRHVLPCNQRGKKGPGDKGLEGRRGKGSRRSGLVTVVPPAFAGPVQRGWAMICPTQCVASIRPDANSAIWSKAASEKPPIFSTSSCSAA